MVVKDGSQRVEALVQVQPTQDPRFYRVAIEGKQAGSVRLFAHGWSPIGAFVYGPRMRAEYYETKEEAVRALATGWLQRMNALIERQQMGLGRRPS